MQWLMSYIRPVVVAENMVGCAMYELVSTTKDIMESSVLKITPGPGWT